MLPEADDELLKLATGYPFPTIGCSYLFRKDGLRPLTGEDLAEFDGRVPVIAHGSNRSPEQLQRKFTDLPAAETSIPVTRAWLADHDVVYSAHVTQYGAIAANLRSTPGTTVEIYVTWLSEPQLNRMHETELGGENYAYGRLSGINLKIEAGPAALLDKAFVYLSVHGCLPQEDQPIGLAAVPAEGRRFGALSQDQVLRLVRDRHRPGRDLEGHILTTIRNVLWFFLKRDRLVYRLRLLCSGIQLYNTGRNLGHGCHCQVIQSSGLRLRRAVRNALHSLLRFTRCERIRSTSTR